MWVIVKKITFIRIKSDIPREEYVPPGDVPMGNIAILQ